MVPSDSGCLLTQLMSLVLVGLLLVVGYNVVPMESASPPEPVVVMTQVVILTATPNLSVDMQPAEYQATIDSLQLTVTALSAPPEQGDAVPTITAIATINPDLLPSVPTESPPGGSSSTSDDDGCVRHIVAAGDTIIAIAQQYGVFPGDILLANGMTESDAALMQIGDELIIPVEGCAALFTPTPVTAPTSTPFVLTQAAPTVTLPPTAVNAQIVIAYVEGAGNVNSEVVEIRNLGSVVNLQGWTLSNTRGDVFRFPEFLMQRDSRALIFSRQGPTTPAALYWGREVPAWLDGETVTLADSTGVVQSTFVVGVDQPLF